MPVSPLGSGGLTALARGAQLGVPNAATLEQRAELPLAFKAFR
jgi:hypothetical protein